MKTSRLVFVLSAFAVSSAYSFAAPTYKLIVGDSLSIQVFQEPKLSQKSVPIDSDGNLAVAALKSPVHIAGLSVAEAEAAITSAYKAQGVVSAPKVSLTVSAYAQRPKKPNQPPGPTR